MPLFGTNIEEAQSIPGSPLAKRARAIQPLSPVAMDYPQQSGIFERVGEAFANPEMQLTLARIGQSLSTPESFGAKAGAVVERTVQENVDRKYIQDVVAGKSPTTARLASPQALAMASRLLNEKKEREMMLSPAEKFQMGIVQQQFKGREFERAVRSFMEDPTGKTLPEDIAASPEELRAAQTAAYERRVVGLEEQLKSAQTTTAKAGAIEAARGVEEHETPPQKRAAEMQMFKDKEDYKKLTAEQQKSVDRAYENIDKLRGKLPGFEGAGIEEILKSVTSAVLWKPDLLTALELTQLIGSIETLQSSGLSTFGAEKYLDTLKQHEEKALRRSIEALSTPTAAPEKQSIWPWKKGNQSTKPTIEY